MQREFLKLSGSFGKPLRDERKLRAADGTTEPTCTSPATELNPKADDCTRTDGTRYRLLEERSALGMTPPPSPPEPSL